MSDRLFLRLAADGGLTWLRRGAAAGASVTGAPPADVLAAAGEVVVLVPGEDVLATEVRLSARSRTQLLQALPYAVEDQLLDPVEDLHFAASRESGESVGVAVVAKAKLRAWLDQLEAQGIRADVVVPDTLAMPLDVENTEVLVENTRACVRLGAWSAFACAPEDFAEWLARVASAGAIKPLRVHDFRAAPPLEVPVDVADYRQRQRDPLAWLARSGLPSLNLLDGEFVPRHRGARGARWWRVAAMLAAAVVLLAVANLGFDVLRLSRESARLDAQAQDAVRKAFPDIDAAQLVRLSPEQLMRSRLDRLRGGAETGGLLRVLSAIAPVLGNAPRIQTRGMEYRAGVLELALRAPDVAALDAVRERFAAVPGLGVEVTAANPGEDGVDGRIRITTGDGHGGTR